MARPKKQPGEPDVRQRIGDACWELLETRHLRDMTVGDVTDRARCNRGTFYYYYTDLNDLVSSVLERELTADGSWPAAVFRLTAGQEPSENWQKSVRSIERVRLVMDRGGMGLVLAKTLEVAMRMWTTVLCPDGSPLKEEARLAIEYSVSGTLGLLALAGATKSGGTDAYRPALMFLQSNAWFLLDKISAAQNVSENELRARLAIVARIAESTKP
ncbi:TetR/AcrR family transcriptional regulator [Gordonibacter sp. 28C]|uniref:TetR/AcrR family transcriptional regulator n=1 Tax=Gordonibacter sp. 28C TaxID=2078569 RepID=UPI0011C0745F|nr:TetR/AcrR family transcriptional regulator [Gordonibacter sp. 28C]